MPLSKQILDEVALSEEEYKLIVKRLGREPNLVELGMFGSLWSEHCGYKHSKPLLKLLPTQGERVLTRIGEENAGAVDLGGGIALVMKMESHNHPSAIEPFQGAATGVGGIVRDIFTMGARPIALLNSLRFGPLRESRNRYLFTGVVAGIASYGNCLGIPDVGGEVFFSEAYSQNPLVNAMCVGLAGVDKLIKSRTGGAGNQLILVGADTGRDGIYGASGLASRTFEEERELRPTVQMGNPFLEKLLIEACLELKGTDWIVGIQDLGAAGLTSAAIEAAARSGSGVILDVLKVPRREEGMTPYEVMLSESQERMLIVARKGYEDRVKTLFQHYDLDCEVIGEVTDDGLARIMEGENVVAEAPIDLLTSPPLYRPQGARPDWLAEQQNFDFNSLPDLEPREVPGIFLKLLSSPNIASKEWVYRQYDHQVGLNTVIPPGSDAAVLRIKGTRKGIGLVTDGNGRYCFLDPYLGGAMAVAEAARNLACVGAEPLAITDCLNFGNPERPEVYWQLEQSLRGMAQACKFLDIPVISGNVSLYNETRGQSIYPTPVVGMAGLLEDLKYRCTPCFEDEGDVVLLLGGGGGLGGSEYLEQIHGLVAGVPKVDLELERQVQRFLLRAIRQGVIKSAHDVSDGGLLAAVAECCLAGSRGFRGKIEVDERLDEALFGEGGSRVVVSLEPRKVGKLEKLAAEHGVPLKPLGVVGGEELIIEGFPSLRLTEVALAWKHGLERELG